MGTAIVGGSIYGMLTYRFYQKMKMGERLALANILLIEISTRLTTVQGRMELVARFGKEMAQGMDRAEYGMKLLAMQTQMSLISNTRSELDNYLLLLDHLNQAVPVETSIDQLIRQGKLTPKQVKSAQALKDIIDSSKSRLSPDDIGALRQLMNTDDALGIKKTLNTVMSYTSVIDDAVINSRAVEDAATGFKAGRIPSVETIKALGQKVAGSSSLSVVKGAEELSTLTPRLVSVVAATESVSAAAGGATKIAKAGKWVGRGVAKVLWMDTVIWGATLGIDLGLNLFMTEEEQADIPVIGFLFEGAGWSPLGWAIEGLIDFFVEPETQQDLFDVFVSTLIAASQEDNIGNAMLMILDFYIDNVSINLLVPLSFPQDFTFEDDLSFNFIPAVDPMIFLEVGIYAIAAKLVFTHWLFPMWGYFIDGLWGNPSATT
jgi:hypothetical protein